MSNWLEQGQVTLNSGRKSSFKIECDNLTDEEIAASCALLAKILPPFGSVSGVPTGGVRVADAIRSYATTGPLLVVDDVWTTGNSVRRHLVNSVDPNTVGPIAVLFARGGYPAEVTALWTLDKRLWNA